MTAVSSPATRAPELGHPVRSFVVALMVLALGLVALQISGLVQPRVTSFGGQGAGIAIEGVPQWTAVVIRNDAPIPVEITDLHWPTKHATDVHVGVQPAGDEVPGTVPPAGGWPTAPFTMQGGETRVVVLSGTTSCGDFVTGPLQLDVRTALGIERTVAIEGSSTSDDGSCP
jgi:hypothetical protein